MMYFVEYKVTCWMRRRVEQSFEGYEEFEKEEVSIRVEEKAKEVAIGTFTSTLNTKDTYICCCFSTSTNRRICPLPSVLS